jgi:transposase
VRCPHCRKIRVEKIPWAQGKCRLTVGLIDVLARWAKWLAWEVVATIFPVSWNTVATAVRQAVDQVRKEETHELKKTNPELLKRTRYLWLKNPENLTDQQRARLGYLERLNLRTNRADLLKECFREFWEYTSKSWAKKFLNPWFWWATHSRLKPMRDFAWMRRRHPKDLLNYFDLRIDNGAVEGMNNKAKIVSPRGYGFRTASTYITALYHCLGNLPEPELVHKFL